MTIREVIKEEQRKFGWSEDDVFDAELWADCNSDRITRKLTNIEMPPEIEDEFRSWYREFFLEQIGRMSPKDASEHIRKRIERN